MTDLLKYAIDGGTLVAFIVVFIALPYMYLNLSAEVHKECNEIAKLYSDKSIKLDENASNYRLNILEKRSHVFSLEWWVVASIAILMIGLFQLAELSQRSRFMPIACRSEVLEAKCTIVSFSDQNLNIKCANETIQCSKVKNAILLYISFIGILFGFRLWWERVAILRETRYVYAGIVREVK